MTAEYRVLWLQLDPDPRLAAAVGGVARYFGDAAGLENAVVSQWQRAILAACQEAFEHMGGDHPQLEVTLTRYPDRIEFALTRHSIAPGGHAKASALLGVDRVQYETRGGEAITRLTKFVSK